MDHAQQVQAFAHQLDRLVEYHRKEFELSYLDVIGMLEIKKTLLVQELLRVQPQDPPASPPAAASGPGPGGGS